MRKLTIRETDEIQKQALMKLPSLTGQNTESKAIWSAICQFEGLKNMLREAREQRDEYRDLAALAGEALAERARAERLRDQALKDLWEADLVRDGFNDGGRNKRCV